MPKDLETFIKGKFKKAAIEKLEKFGGRIQVSITAPYTDRTIQDKTIIIDSSYIQALIDKPLLVKERLFILTKEQIMEVCRYLKFPISTKSTIKEIRNELIKYLNSEKAWRSISGLKGENNL